MRGGLESRCVGRVYGADGKAKGSVCQSHVSVLIHICAV